MSEVRNLTESQRFYYNEARPAYAITAPALMALCMLSFIVNCFYVILILKWTHYSRNLTLKLTCSLAATDAFSSLMIASGLLMNSYLAVFYQEYVTLDGCLMFVHEGFRIGSMVTSVLHYLALSVNHLLAIDKPIFYQSLSSSRASRSIFAIIISMWLVPPGFMMIIFGVNFHETFGGRYTEGGCRGHLIDYFWFRIVIFCVIFIPLLLMTAVYIRVGVKLKMVQKRLRNITHSATTRRLPKKAMNGASAQNCEIAPMLLRGDSFDSAAQSSPRAHKKQQSEINAHKRQIRTIITALLIVGTFLLGWVPGILWYAVTCPICPHPISKLNNAYPKLVYGFGITVNTLIISKGLLNPLIYACRMPEIQQAFQSLRSGRMPSRNSRASAGGSSLQPNLSRRASRLKSIFLPTPYPASTKPNQRNLVAVAVQENGTAVLKENNTLIIADRGSTVQL